jgi:predicted transcriptional regulator
MMEILMSIEHRWAEKIYSGEKTLEVRKSAPPHAFEECGVPQKHSINYYCMVNRVWLYETKNSGGGKITGYFDCIRFIPIFLFEQGGRKLAERIPQACMTPADWDDYAASAKKKGYLIGWGICNAVRLAEPLELDAFHVKGAPQSWMYVADRCHVPEADDIGENP